MIKMPICLAVCVLPLNFKDESWGSNPQSSNNYQIYCATKTVKLFLQSLGLWSRFEILVFLPVLRSAIIFLSRNHSFKMLIILTLTDCPEGYIFHPISSSCIRLGGDKVTWDQAKYHCEAQAETLAVLPTLADINWLNNFMNDEKSPAGKCRKSSRWQLQVNKHPMVMWVTLTHPNRK